MFLYLVIAVAETDVFCVIEILALNWIQDEVSYNRVRWGKSVDFQSSVSNVTYENTYLTFIHVLSM